MIKVGSTQYLYVVKDRRENILGIYRNVADPDEETILEWDKDELERG